MTIGLTRIRAWLLILSAALVSPVMLLSLACGRGDNTLTVYSGRSQNLVHPILERFIEDSGGQHTGEVRRKLGHRRHHPGRRERTRRQT